MDAGVGSLVQVSFHGRQLKGWVLGPAEEVPPRLLKVRKVLSRVRFFDEEMLGLLRWVAERYVAPLASVISRSHPPRVVSEEASVGTSPGSPRLPAVEPAALSGYRGGGDLLTAIAGSGGAFVVRPAPEDEVVLVVEAVGAALSAGRAAIVLLPEADPLPATAAALLRTFGRRVGLYAGGDRRERYRRWLEIASGRYDCVVGTRPAVFAPLRAPGLVWISRESHPGHREERSPYYHVRDVGLARVRASGGVCAMAALCPSVEASVSGAQEVAPRGRRWPPVEVVRPGPEGRAPRLIAALKSSRRAFLYEPLPGYGVAQLCRSCDEPARCAACGGVLRSERGTVRCAVCGADARCAACGSAEFRVRRGGAERVEEWARGVATVPVRRVTGARAGPPVSSEVVVGGPEAVRDAGPVGLDLVGILDADLARRRPGISAVERALATWMEAAGWARPAGRAIVQTRHPNDPAVQALVAGNPERFHRSERSRREEAGFPAGYPVFRVTGSEELPAALERLEPANLLVSRAGRERICLLTLAPGAVAAFGATARELASREVVSRVEAEPHL